MSLMILAWLAFLVLLAVLAFVRPIWGVGMYMLTVFACPGFWWWGKAIGHYRWNFYAGCVLLVAVLLSTRPSDSWFPDTPTVKKIKKFLAAIVINATLVHVLLADSMAISSGPYIELVKFSGLICIMVAAVKDKRDFHILCLMLIVGASYIGYESSINGRGNLRGNRLEGIGMPNAASANGLACLFVTLLPLLGALLLNAKKWAKLLPLVAAPLMVDVLLMCNSRGAFLASISSAIVFLVGCPAKTRKQAMKLVALGAVVVWLLLGDPEIINRFMSTFEDGERDRSAASRLDYWQAGFAMLADYPLGAGGDGFHDMHGSKYLRKVGYYYESRSVHNGHINEMCDWGLQGYFLRISLIALAMWNAYLTSRRRTHVGDAPGALLGTAIIASFSGFLVCAMFGDYMDNEWGYWMVAISIAYAKVYGDVPEEEVPIHAEYAAEPRREPALAGSV